VRFTQASWRENLQKKKSGEKLGALVRREGECALVPGFVGKEKKKRSEPVKKENSLSPAVGAEGEDATRRKSN